MSRIMTHKERIIAIILCGITAGFIMLVALETQAHSSRSYYGPFNTQHLMILGAFLFVIIGLIIYAKPQGAYHLMNT